MSVPNFRDHRTYLRSLFEVLAEKGSAKPGDIYAQVADRAGIPQSVRSELSPQGGRHPIYCNRIQFARQSLVDAGVLLGPNDPEWQRGVWELSREGVAIAQRGLSGQALDELLNQRAVEGTRKRAQEREKSMELAGLNVDREPGADNNSASDHAYLSQDSSDALETLSLSAIRVEVESANQAVMATMLEHVRAMPERAFEYLVGSVLQAALKAETVSITQQSRDGGFDGLLTFDSLGIRIAVFEAKRYNDGNVVGRQHIDAFATAVRRRKATHGLFVTSSRFSAEAIDSAKNESIRLVDGIAFVELMAKHGFGLRAREQFTIYEIDPAWSVEDELAI